MFDLPPKIVIFDTEVTTDEGVAARNWSGHGEYRELVQLAAAVVETRNFQELLSMKALVKPEINPVLSGYFIKLTGITQEEVETSGRSFPTFLKYFHKWCHGYQLYSFDEVRGSRLFDRDVLIENCDLHGLAFPFEMGRFRNIKEIFAKHGVAVEQSGRAPEAFGEKPRARSHDALNDVRGLIRGLQLLKKKVA